MLDRDGWIDEPMSARLRYFSSSSFHFFLFFFLSGRVDQMVD